VRGWRVAWGFRDGDASDVPSTKRRRQSSSHLAGSLAYCNCEDARLGQGQPLAVDLQRVVNDGDVPANGIRGLYGTKRSVVNRFDVVA
jgi:hypothetical protein